MATARASEAAFYERLDARIEKAIAAGKPVVVEQLAETEGEFTIGCAGGVDVNVSGEYEEVDVPAGSAAYLLTVKGLTGGHSGMDIHLGRGNANKLLNRILLEADNYFGIGIAAIIALVVFARLARRWQDMDA